MLLTHKFRLEKTQEYKTLIAGVIQIIRDFPELRDDLKQAKNDADELVNKLREVYSLFCVTICAYMHLTNVSQFNRGMQAARQADSSTIRRDISLLAAKDAEKRGWTVSHGVRKGDQGLKSEHTARFILPLDDREEYLKDPKT